MSDELKRALDTIMKPGFGGASSSIDYQQQRGAGWDVVDQAIQEYDDWMADDDYDAMTKLHGIIGRMRARRALYRDGEDKR